MSKIDQFADDVPDILAEMEAEFDALSEKARAVKERGKDAAHAWHAHFDAKAAEIDKVEKALQRVSNLPLPPSSSTSEGAGRANGTGEKNDDPHPPA